MKTLFPSRQYHDDRDFFEYLVELCFQPALLLLLDLQLKGAFLRMKEPDRYVHP